MCNTIEGVFLLCNRVTMGCVSWWILTFYKAKVFCGGVLQLKSLKWFYIFIITLLQLLLLLFQLLFLVLNVFVILLLRTMYLFWRRGPRIWAKVTYTFHQRNKLVWSLVFWSLYLGPNIFLFLICYMYIFCYVFYVPLP